MTNESRRLAVTGSATKRLVVLTFSMGHPWRLHALFDDRVAWDVEDSDLFECLIQVRKRLESEGGLICCEGARWDVFPSGMARQMGGARRAYRLVPDRTAESPALVDIFAPTPCDAVVSVSEQIESVRKLHRG